MSTNTDRTIHGWTADGSEIVRYDRSGKWYIEPLPAAPGKRLQVSLADAVAAALLGKHALGRPGGSMFDAKIRKQLDTTR
ncbi:hypothetical protein SAMN06295974_3855 [Plantibacter flavus]|uniref:Uncharacterized protein n=1 Tax=Plantibacter flavus TaxID=150123 RepID=A0A3N2BL70_9MICO|nr:hypothetical protein [Plantibacter flavus]ROR75999.1 hypothetical protein EDD42_3951 [Plantibacter flavus]SMG49499.1 hypothetical protein SAMN06295974_3855 [Plantibacter flavus]